MSILQEKTRKMFFQGRIKTEDGHLVRSRGEALIANGLFHRKIWYIYEKTIWFDENKYLKPDFYLPDIDMYIEYWGLNDDEYNTRRKKKEKMYLELGLNLFSIENEHLYDLYKCLNKLLLYQKAHIYNSIDTGSLSLAELNIQKKRKPICLQGETIIGTIITEPVRGVTNRHNNFIQFNILDRGETAVIRVFGNHNTKNLDLAATLSIGKRIALLNPFLPPKTYHSADIWINEIKSYIFPLS